MNTKKPLNDRLYNNLTVKLQDTLNNSIYNQVNRKLSSRIYTKLDDKLYTQITQIRSRLHNTLLIELQNRQIHI